MGLGSSLIVRIEGEGLGALGCSPVPGAKVPG